MEKLLPEITIRQFEKQDFKKVERIVLQGFKNKFSVLSSLGDQNMLALFADTGFVPTQSFKGYLVAIYKEQICGVMLLKWTGQRKKAETTHNFFQLVLKYGLPTMVKYYICLALLEEYIDNHTCYVELLAVDEEARGLGVGTALLTHGLQIMKEDPALHTFSLFVAEGNTAAYRLYERMGIVEKCKKKNLLAKLFFKEASWVYMSTISSFGNKRYYLKRKGWWLGFLGGMGFINLPVSWFWFVCFLWFIPERR